MIESLKALNEWKTSIRKTMTYRLELMICAGTSCISSDADILIEQFKEEISAQGLDADIHVVQTGCFGFCGQGPILKIEPDNVTYVQVGFDDVSEIVTTHLKNGETITRLTYNPPGAKKQVASDAGMPRQFDYQTLRRPIMKLIDSMVQITINNISLEVPKDATVLEAAKAAGIDIPTLCHLNLHDLDAVNQSVNCRVCLVENEDRGNLVPSCAQKVTEGMRIQTDTKKAVQGRRTSLELILSNHPKDCLTCVKNLDCDLQSLANKMNIKEIHYTGEMMDHPIDKTSGAIIKDPNKCIMCRRCITMCDDVQTIGVLSPLKRGFDVTVGTAFLISMILVAPTAVNT